MITSYFDALISCGNEVTEGILLRTYIGHNYTEYFDALISCDNVVTEGILLCHHIGHNCI